MQVGKFAAWPAIAEAWRRINGARLTYLYMTAAVFVIMFAVSFALSIVLPASAPEWTTGPDGELVRRSTAVVTGNTWMFGSFTAHDSLGGTLVSAVVAALFSGSFSAYALRRAQGLEVRFSMLTKYARYALPIFMLALATHLAAMLLGAIGPVLATILFIAGSVAFTFTSMFIVDRDHGALQALEASLRVVSGNVWQTSLLLLSGAVLGLAAALPIIVLGGVLPPVGAVALGLATAVVMTLVQGLMLVATACAYRDAVEIEKSGDELPVGGRAAPVAISSRA